MAGPTDDATLRERFREQTGVTFPFLLSTPPPAHLLAKDAMVTYYPFHLVIDGAGQVVHTGKDLHTGSLLQAVRSALGAAPKP